MNESSIPAPELVDAHGKRKLPRRGTDASVENRLPNPALPNQPSPKRKIPKRSIASVGEVPREASMPPVVNPPFIRGKGSKKPLTATASSGNLPGENSSLPASYQSYSKRKAPPRMVNAKLNGIFSQSSSEHTAAARTPLKKTGGSHPPNGLLSRTSQTPPLSPSKRKSSSPNKKSTPLINGSHSRFLIPSAQAGAKNCKKTVSSVTKSVTSSPASKIKSPKTSGRPKIVQPVKTPRNSVDNSKIKATRRSSLPLKNVTSKMTSTKSASKAKPKCSKLVTRPSLNPPTQPVVVEDPSPSPVVDSPLPEPEIPAETASMGAVSEEPPVLIQDKRFQVKCPPFCSTVCTDEHSPLLLALLNCNDDIDNFLESASFKELLAVMDYYRKEKGWKKNSAIFDVNPGYRYPLIHWAAILSKINVVKWMSSSGYNINVLHGSTGDSALHRVLLCVRAVIKNNPVSLEKFSDLLEVLQPNLNIKNKSGITPFLTVCATVGQDTRSHSRHVNLLKTILNFAKKTPGLLDSLLKQETPEGDTALHLLALKDKHLGPLKMLVDAGADVYSQNKMGKTPLSMAMEAGELRISQFFEKHILTMKEPCPDTPSSSVPSSQASSSNSPSESAADNIPPVEEADVPHNTASPTSIAASETDASTSPLSKRIKIEGNPSDYESDVSENTIRFALSKDNSTKVRHVIRKSSAQTSDGILKQYFHVCNDRARENLIASINMDKQQCLDELKVTEEQIASLSRKIDAICSEKHRKEVEIRKLMLEMKAFDQTLNTLNKEKQQLTDKSSSLDAKVSLCLSVLQIVHDKNT